MTFPVRRSGAETLRVVAIVLVLASLGAAPRAAAQQEPGPPASPPTGAPDPSRDAEARALFDAGRTSFEAGRYADALGYFLRSHELSGRPALLFNIAGSHDRLRHDEAALAAFESYLQNVPDARNRAEVQARIVLLRDAIAARESERARLAERQQREAAAAAGRVAESAPPEPPQAAPRPRIFTWIAAGVAVVSAGVATWAWVDANSRYDSLETGCFAARGGCTPAEVAASGVDSRVTLTNVFAIAAVVAGAAAITLFFLEAPRDRAPEAAHAEVAATLGGVVVRGAF